MPWNRSIVVRWSELDCDHGREQEWEDRNHNVAASVVHSSTVAAILRQKQQAFSMQPTLVNCVTPNYNCFCKLSYVGRGCGENSSEVARQMFVANVKASRVSDLFS